MEQKSVKKSMINFNKLREKAMQIAENVHSHQVDKGGNPYIGHPVRVERMCSKQEDRLVAILHDTVEDGDIASEYLIMVGFPKDVVDAVISVSRKRGEDYFDFILRCKANPIGRRVKICDLKDNMDITRLNDLTEEDIERLKKYHKAYKILNE